jgi:Mn2+/Fe2+ NRAMP family transporter
LILSQFAQVVIAPFVLTTLTLTVSHVVIMATKKEMMWIHAERRVA